MVHHAGRPDRGLLHWYRDPLPTNCVADWVCSGHRRVGMHNLAVFYASCTLDCLFCQNWHFREAAPETGKTEGFQTISAASLADQADQGTHCVCFFGGDPASQMPHALAAGKMLARRGVVVCWETAGTMNPRLMRKALELSIESGGCMKFDLKAFDEALHMALTGGSNRRTLENFALAAEVSAAWPSSPPLVASTLLVPGYVDAKEVGQIAAFIAELNPEIPYALLAFYPAFLLHDLPCTSAAHASEALEAAHASGLRNVRLGNIQLLARTT